ncbi:MAG: diphthine--ammonia ligase [Roseivirga sp.]|nr:diphthine--ammonia ligase [Roseivirga sp.]
MASTPVLPISTSVLQPDSNLTTEELNSYYPFLCSWSGGKDSYFAFYKAIQNGAIPKVLFNVMNEHGDRSRSHGIPREVLLEQASCLGLPIEFIESTWSEYEQRFIAKLKDLKAAYEFTHAVYGDIDIQSHRDWEEKVSTAADLTAVLPLWQGDRLNLVHDMIDCGIRALIVSCRAEYADQILGKYIDKNLISVFEQLGIDACGENGEYHTLVADGPAHKRPLIIDRGKQVTHGHYSFLELTL